MAAITFKTFDVRAMLAQGIEPYPEIRRRIDALAPGAGVTIVAPFLPAPLIEKLKSEGFGARVEHRSDGAWTTSFWRDIAA
jgi:uncharacterized protein (DUF2249 family)